MMSLESNLWQEQKVGERPKTEGKAAGELGSAANVYVWMNFHALVCGPCA